MAGGPAPRTRLEEAFPKMLRNYGETLFDYAAEDAWLEWYDRSG